MRIVVWGCTHIGKTLSGYSWAKDLSLAAESVIEESKRSDLVIHLGDLFDHGRPTPKEYSIALEILDEIDSPMVLMKGNHDENPGIEPDALEPLLHFRFRHDVKIVRCPIIIGAMGHALAFVPFQTDVKARNVHMNGLTRSRMVNGASAQEQIDKVVSLSSGALELNRSQLMISESSEQEFEKVSAMFTHVDIDGLERTVEMEDGWGGANLKLDVLKSLPFDVVVGHYHKSSEVKPNIYVVGSALPFDFSEVGVTKYFLIVNL